MERECWMGLYQLAYELSWSWRFPELIRRTPGTGWLLGDAQYDSNELFDLAFEQGFQLLAPRRKKGRFGHHYLSPHRRFSVQLLEGGGWKPFHRNRTNIERKFGNCTSFGGGLAVLSYGRNRLWPGHPLLNAGRMLKQDPPHFEDRERMLMDHQVI